MYTKNVVLVPRLNHEKNATMTTTTKSAQLQARLNQINESKLEIIFSNGWTFEAEQEEEDAWVICGARYHPDDYSEYRIDRQDSTESYFVNSIAPLTGITFDEYETLMEEEA